MSIKITDESAIEDITRTNSKQLAKPMAIKKVTNKQTSIPVLKSHVAQKNIYLYKINTYKLDIK